LRHQIPILRNLCDSLKHVQHRDLRSWSRICTLLRPALQTQDHVLMMFANLISASGLKLRLSKHWLSTETFSGRPATSWEQPIRKPWTSNNLTIAHTRSKIEVILPTLIILVALAASILRCLARRGLAFPAGQQNKL